MLTTIELHTPSGESMTDITGRVRAAVGESGVVEGLCIVFVPHTTAGLTLNSGVDLKTAADIVSEMRRIVPTRVDFQHTYDTPADAAGHIKTTLVGSSASLIVSKGQLLLGGSQSIFFFEFDGPRSRQILLRLVHDA
jgi:secondary thiamine-phosphate synthase enzyme